jgi:hypothetical protein
MQSKDKDAGYRQGGEKVAIIEAISSSLPIF